MCRELCVATIITTIGIVMKQLPFNLCIYWLCIEITPSLFIMFGAMLAETGKRTMATTREKKTTGKKNHTSYF